MSQAEVLAFRSERFAPRVGQSSVFGAGDSHNGVSMTSASSNASLIDEAIRASRRRAERSERSGISCPILATALVLGSSSSRLGMVATSCCAPLRKRTVEFHNDANP